ncbi:hypothetical protein TPY_1339 [Sulfobacillus acidophilus TPY]|uniref:Cupin 2 conserved barrel domain protein n=1 Tax=Sulfobacillus acidophilus (strain ATCC 700253 / DSM 10332 / NAL) TaxID=679936 RepID=G8TUR1_SULAD|nr:hypothetical protein TPY_1339 [Sulfobacillus acidophilus TPY]AEW05785.1 Cupin 2 conserved barrel domain protein [Sulfobacillus acidophilus DSM 10332]
MFSWTKTLDQYETFRISPGDSNKFVLLVDGVRLGRELEEPAASFMMAIEIFDPGGRTPINVHEVAFEHFFVLAGEGRAFLDDFAVALVPGAHLVVPPKTVHYIVNQGVGRLYLLTSMIPDEGFSTLIRAGIPDALDAEDEAVIRHAVKAVDR